MLPSSGYFQSIICPFFKNGLCERAHCHYKHVKPDGSEKSKWSGDDAIFAAIYRSSETPNRPAPYTYIPTPVDKTVTKSGGILKAPLIKTEKGPSVPVYKPTPINHLKHSEEKPIVITLDSSPRSSAIRKRKKVDEYDPEEVRYSKKRVSFNLPEENEAGQSEIITLSSDEEGEPTAKFSDDDFTDDDVDRNKVNTQEIPEKAVVIKIEAEDKETAVKELSPVDEILDVVKNEEFIRGFKKPIKTEVNHDNNVNPSCLKTEEDNVEVNKFKNVNIDGLSSKVSPSKEIVQEICIKKEPENEILPEKSKGLPEGKSSEQKNKELEKQQEKTKAPKEKLKEHKKDKSSKEGNTKSSEHGKEKMSHKEKVKDDKKKSSSTSKSSDEKSRHLKSDTKDKSKKTTEDKSTKSEKSTKDAHKHSHSKSAKHSSSKSDTHKSVKSTDKSKKSDDKSVKNDDKTKHSKKLSETKEKTDKNKLSRDKSKSSKNTVHSKTKHSDKTSDGKTESSKLHSTSKVNDKTKSSKTSNESDKKDLTKASKKIQDGKISSSSVVRSKEVSSYDNLDKEIASSDDAASDGYVDDSEIHELYNNASDSDMDSDTLEECYRIFNEDKKTTNVADQKKLKESVMGDDEVVYPSTSPTKKRLAHQPDLARKSQGSPLRKKDKQSPAQVMHNRYLKLQEQYSRMDEGKDGNTQKKSSIPLGAHIAANVQKLLSANANNSGSSATSFTPVNLKGDKRVAHVPIVARSARPIIPSAYGSKVASNIRQKYLNSFIDECLKFCHTEENAYETALEEEKNAYNRSTNKTIYLNIAANALNRLRRKAREGPSSDGSSESTAASKVSSTTQVPSSSLSRTISHEMMLAGPRAQKFSYSIERKKSQKAPEVVLKGELLYNMLSEYVLTEEQLTENGFPQPHETELGRVVITGIYANKTPASNDPSKRRCSRCSKTYFVDEDGDYIKEEECDYHWGRIYKRRIAGSIESRYMCCSGDAESDGCCVSAGHVFEGSDEHLLNGFVKTQRKTPVGKNYGVYALDCEMCYTTAGMELTRVTIIGPDMDPVFNSFVVPSNKVLDYNTRFSGITAEDLVGQSKSLRDVQDILLGLFSSKTILIGHSLESDFKALKLVHKTVVDTSVVFPHKMGLPFKRALRTLMAEYCHKIIQNSIGGHDSHEDAAACMELMLSKLKEDLRSSGRA